MEDKKENIFSKTKGFFKKAFKDMGDSAKAQHEVDKANLNAVKAESRANFEENRGKNTFKKAKEDAKNNWNNARMSNDEKIQHVKEEQQKKIEEANARYEAIKVEKKKD